MARNCKCPNPACDYIILKSQGRCRRCGTFANPEEVLSQVANHFQTRTLLTGLQRLGPQTKLQLMSRGFSHNLIEHLMRCGILVREQDPATHLYYLKVDDALLTP